MKCKGCNTETECDNNGYCYECSGEIQADACVERMEDEAAEFERNLDEFGKVVE